MSHRTNVDDKLTELTTALRQQLIEQEGTFTVSFARGDLVVDVHIDRLNSMFSMSVRGYSRDNFDVMTKRGCKINICSEEMPAVGVGEEAPEFHMEGGSFHAGPT